ncbi:MAG: acyl-CoA/acyl-ACP dehydrogenase, partial [Cohaesibacter sp.]|nr:acyl-CoA/acyl-ACP dehydrogenase [Cohaesibacter sp.]
MIEWNETQRTVQGMVRDFVEKEIVPHIDELEYGGMPPYDILRKFVKTFGLDEMAKANFDKQIAKEEAKAAGAELPEDSAGDSMRDPGLSLIPTIEISRHAQGLVTAMGVSMSLTGGAIMSKGTLEQKKRWALPLLTLDKVGAWAITEPNSGSDAFGQMKSTARKVDGGYLLNGNKTFITNGPFADTIVFICKLDQAGVEPKHRKVVSFILDSGMQGLTQSEPFKKMGIGASPTGELFLDDVFVETD